MKRIDKQTCPRPRIHGFTLIEAMVAMVVLSVGLLGVAGLQMSGMRSVQGAQYRSDSTRLAEGLLDRMRANMPGVRSEDYMQNDVASFIKGKTEVDCSANVCTSAQLATNDLIAWYSELETLLKLPADTEINAGVYCTADLCDTDSVITVAVAWRERNEDKEAADDEQLVTKSYILNTVL